MIPDADIVWDKREQSRNRGPNQKAARVEADRKHEEGTGAHSVLFQLQNRRDQAGRRDSGVCDGL